MGRPTKMEHEKVQYNVDFTNRSLRLDLRNEIERQIAEFLQHLPNANNFLKSMVVQTLMFDKFVKEQSNSIYGNDEFSNFGFIQSPKYS